MKFLLAFSFAIPAIAQTMNEFTQGGCKSVVMIYARGSAEGGNVVCLSASSQPTEHPNGLYV